MWRRLVSKWPMWLVLAVAALRIRERDVISQFLIAAGALGVLMNVLVIVLNGAMPVKLSEDEIPASKRGEYKPIDSATRLAFLSDWIPVGSWLISLGDVVLVIATTGLLLLPLFK